MSGIQIAATFLSSAISAIVGLVVWRIQRQTAKNDKKREGREAVLMQHNILMVESVGAAIALGEATAIAQRNGKCNGETERALAYAQEVKHKQKDFLYQQGVKSVWEA